MTALVTSSIFGLRRARSSMIFDARNSSRRWTTVTLGAKRVRKVASSIAVSPPPTTTRSRPLKSAPSQVAQADTPYFWNFSSDGMPSHLADAPVAMISVSAASSPSVETTLERAVADRSTGGDVGGDARCVPKRSACALNSSISSGPWIPSGKPG